MDVCNPLADGGGSLADCGSSQFNNAITTAAIAAIPTTAPPHQGAECHLVRCAGAGSGEDGGSGGVLVTGCSPPEKQNEARALAFRHWDAELCMNQANARGVLRGGLLGGGCWWMVTRVTPRARAIWSAVKFCEAYIFRAMVIFSGIVLRASHRGSRGPGGWRW